MYLISGLGNPGAAYAESRHNMGFMVVNRLADKWSIQVTSRKFQSAFGKGVVHGKVTLLVKPQTFMNLSGEAVARWVRYFGDTLSNMMIIHDDLDMEFGRIKLVRKGGTGGHKGVASVLDALGGMDVPRLKVGIGRPRFHESVEEFVLKPFYDDQRPFRDEVVERAVCVVEKVILHGLDKAMEEVNKT